MLDKIIRFLDTRISFNLFEFILIIISITVAHFIALGGERSMTAINVLIIILFYHVAEIFVRAFMDAFYLTHESRLEKRLDLLEKNFSESTLDCYDNEGR